MIAKNDKNHTVIKAVYLDLRYTQTSTIKRLKLQTFLDLLTRGRVDVI